MSKIRDSIISSPERTMVIDLTSASSSSSFPVVFSEAFNVGVNINISSTNKTGTDPVNYSTLLGVLHAGGWNDTRTFYDVYYSTYDLTDRAIIKMAFPAQTTRATAVYLRGGTKYNIKTDALITYTGGAVTLGDVTYPVSDISDSISGGTNIYKVIPFNYNKRFVGNVNAAFGEIINPTLNAGWSSYGSGYAIPTIYAQDGLVTLSGLVKQATPANNNSMIFSLPAALVPASSHICAVSASVASSVLSVPLYISNGGVFSNAISTSSTLGWLSLSCTYPLT